MNDNQEQMKARGIYLAGVGLLLMGISGIIYSINSIVSAALFSRQLEIYSLGPRVRTTQSSGTTTEDAIHFFANATSETNDPGSHSASRQK